MRSTVNLHLILRYNLYHSFLYNKTTIFIADNRVPSQDAAAGAASASIGRRRGALPLGQSRAAARRRLSARAVACAGKITRDLIVVPC